MIRRSFPVLAALSLLAACGDDPDAGSGLPVLRIGSSAAGGAAEASGLASDAMMPNDKAMWVPANWEFVVNGDLPALDTDAVAYVFREGSEPTADQLATLLEVFDVDGSFTRTTTDPGTDYEWTSWSVGPNDGSGPAITVSDDGLLSWWYSEGWQATSVGRPAPCPDTEPSAESSAGSSGSSDTSDTSDTSPVVPDVACEEWVEPQPPANVPSASEAEAAFRDLFARLGFASDEFVIESYADDWSAGAWGFVLVDGVRSSLTVSASFGENGRLTYAGGYLGRPEVLATYPRIGTEAGLDRLRDDYGAIMAPAMGGPAIDDTPVASDDAVVSETVVPETSEPATTEPVTTEPSTTEPVTSTSEEIPVDSVPTNDTVAPETITIEIVDVEEEYVLYWSVDGDVYLVPGYTFVAAEDEWGYRGRYTVPAIPSEYLDIVQPPMVGEPMPEPMPADSALPGEGDVIGIAPEDAERLVGLSEKEATASAESQGWVVRVVARDGEEFPITMDYSTGRVNLTIEDDVVTEVYVG